MLLVVNIIYNYPYSIHILKKEKGKKIIYIHITSNVTSNFIYIFSIATWQYKQNVV